MGAIKSVGLRGSTKRLGARQSPAALNPTSSGSDIIIGRHLSATPRQANQRQGRQRFRGLFPRMRWVVIRPTVVRRPYQRIPSGDEPFRNTHLGLA
jgi:hypothetical protein